MKHIFIYTIIFAIPNSSYSLDNESLFSNYGIANRSANIKKHYDDALKRYENALKIRNQNKPYYFVNSPLEYFITKNINGEYIVLDDGSIFKVESYDINTSSLWLEYDEVILNSEGDKMINIDQEDFINVIQIQ